MIPHHGSLVFGPVLERLNADAQARFGPGPVRLLPVAYDDRPSSHLLRVSVSRAGSNTPVTHVFVKVFKPKPIAGGLEAMRRRVARDYETTFRMYGFMREDDRLGVVPPVACYPDLLALATEEVTGQTLLHHLETAAAWFPTENALSGLSELMTTAGRWLRVFQNAMPKGAQLTIDGLRDYIDVRLQRLVRASVSFDERDRRAVLRHIDFLGQQIAFGELAEVSVHSDFGPGNILIAGRRVVLLDFGMTRLGADLLDVTRLYAQIGLLRVKPWFRDAAIQRLQTALLAGFDQSLTGDRPLFRLMLLLHTINHFATAAAARGRIRDAVYNRLVSREHRRWIARELSRRATPSAV